MAIPVKGYVFLWIIAVLVIGVSVVELFIEINKADQE
jgi:hypothetical protein